MMMAVVLKLYDPFILKQACTLHSFTGKETAYTMTS